MEAKPIFSSFFIGGFECSCHRRFDHRRLDLMAATAHDELVSNDYSALSKLGVRTVRDGIRWHLVEPAPGVYEWSSFLPMLEASEKCNVQVIWDLCHYGWPDDLDIWSPEFLRRFVDFAASVAAVVARRSNRSPWYCTINEISYWAWAGGEVCRMNPHASGRGHDLKQQLCRASIAATQAIRAIDPRARFISAEPLIHVAGRSDRREMQLAEDYRLAQYEAVDWLLGSGREDVQGRGDNLDIVGVNFYPDNQWYLGGPPIPFGSYAYRPLREMLYEVHHRYGKPIMIAETGAEGGCRPAWLHYVCQEVAAAIEQGVPVEGLCLYPIAEYPGLDNDRDCAVGLLSRPDAAGNRSVCRPLEQELRRQQGVFETSLETGSEDRRASRISRNVG